MPSAARVETIRRLKPACEIRLDHYPLTWLRIHSLERLDVYTAIIREFYQAISRRAGHFSVIVHVDPHVRVDARVRGAITGAMREFDALLRERCLRQAVVLHSAFHRSVLTAMTWIYPPPFQLRTFTDEQSAEAWAREGLQ